MRLFKKLAIVMAVVLAVFVGIAIIVPLMVDVDKYRPQIVQMADEHLNGKLELGKLSLSLWGQVRIEAAGMKLSDAQGRPTVTVKDAFFHLPLMSFLSGSPVLTFKMQKPEVNVIKDKDGKLNVANLVKPTQPAPGASPTPGASPSPQPKVGEQPSKVTLPAIATRARMGVEFRDANVNYKDEVGGMTTQVKDLNLVVRNISLTHTMELEMWADLDTAMTQKGKTTMTVKGPARLTGKATPQLVEGNFEQAVAELKANLDDLVITMPGLFEKKKGVAANAEGVFKYSAKEARIEKLDIRFFNAEVMVSGAVSNISQSTPPASPIVDVAVRSNEIALQPWSELVPMLKDYQLGGTADFNASVSGPSDKLNYQGTFNLKDVTAKAPKLKAQPNINAVVKIATDQIESFNLTMKAPGNDLRISGKLVSFLKPALTATVTSTGMDLDQLIEFPPPKSKVAAAKGEGKVEGKVAGAPAATPSGKPEDYDALLNPLRETPIAAAASAVVDADIKMLKAYNVRMTDIKARKTFRNLTASIDHFSMNLWGGSVKANGSANLKPKAPVYRFSSEAGGLDLQQAVTSQFELLKNTIVGKASFKMSGEGESFNPEPAKLNLKAKGNMKVENAKFATIDVGKMVSDAISKSVGSLAEKIPQIKGKMLNIQTNRETRYALISSDFAIAGGKFSAPNFTAKAAPNQGIDLKGDTTVGLVDYSLAANWEVIDTFNFSHARDLSVEQSGVKVEHILAEGNNPVKFPVHVGGTVFQPKYSYTEVPTYLGKVAMANVSSALTGKAKAEVRKQLEEKAKQLSPKAQDTLKNLGKKLFGR